MLGAYPHLPDSIPPMSPSGESLDASVHRVPRESKAAPKTPPTRMVICVCQTCTVCQNTSAIVPRCEPSRVSVARGDVNQSLGNVCAIDAFHDKRDAPPPRNHSGDHFQALFLGEPCRLSHLKRLLPRLVSETLRFRRGSAAFSRTGLPYVSDMFLGSR